ncbi:MAG: hypothetical protein WEC36_11515 [Phycisphaeraceae bacterium]
MFLHLFDEQNLRACSGFIPVPGPVRKLGPVAGTASPDAQASPWALDAFSGCVLPRAPQDGGGHRAYVTAFHKDPQQMHRSRPFVCESDDGLNWSPRGLVEFADLPADFAGYLKQPSVLRLGDGRYRMYVWFHGQRKGDSVARLGTAISDDGLAFRLERFDPPILYHINELKRWGFEPGLTPEEAFQAQQQATAAQAGTQAPPPPSPQLLATKRLRSNDSTNVFRDPATGQFVLYGVLFLQNPLGSPRREERDNARSLLRIIIRRTSDDGLTFSDPQIVLTPDALDPLDQQFYYLSLHRQDGYHFGFLGDYEVAAQTMDLGLAVSRDGVAWRRPMRSPLLTRDPESFDSQSIYLADNLIDAGDDWLLLYRGGTLPHNTGSQQHRQVTMAMARVGKRRLIGMDTAGNRDARLLTAPLLLTQPRLTLDALVRGHLRAELCNAFGDPVPGYRRQDFIPVQGDSRAHVLQWKGGPTAIFHHEPLSLRLEATDATLFALEV